MSSKECPYKPEELHGPIGQHHCPICGIMVVAGMYHPKFVTYIYAEDISEEDEIYLGMLKKTGWHVLTLDYGSLGPFNSEEEAYQAFEEDRKRRFF